MEKTQDPEKVYSENCRLTHELTLLAFAKYGRGWIDRNDALAIGQAAGWQAANCWDGVRPFKPLLRTVVERHILNAVKSEARQKQQIHRRALSLDELIINHPEGRWPKALVDETTNPELAFEFGEMAKAAREVLNSSQLSPVELGAFVLVQCHRLSYAEVATALQISRKAVDNANRRAIKKIAATRRKLGFANYGLARFG